MAPGHLDEPQKAEKYPIRWSLYTGFIVAVWWLYHIHHLFGNILFHDGFMTWDFQHYRHFLCVSSQRANNVEICVSSSFLSWASCWTNNRNFNDFRSHGAHVTSLLSFDRFLFNIVLRVLLLHNRHFFDLVHWHQKNTRHYLNWIWGPSSLTQVWVTGLREVETLYFNIMAADALATFGNTSTQ